MPWSRLSSLLLLFLLPLSTSVLAAGKDPLAAAFEQLSKESQLLEGVATQPSLKQAEALGGLGLAALQVLDGARAASYFERALEKLEAQEQPIPGAQQKLLSLRLQGHRLAGAWVPAADAARDLQELLEKAGGKTTEAWREVTLERWRMLELAGDEATAKVVAADLRTGAPESQWVRRLDLESRRQTPVALLPLTYSANIFVDPSGRPVTPAYASAKPFEADRAPVQIGKGWGALDARLRLCIPPRFTRLDRIRSFPSFFRAKVPSGPGEFLWGVIDSDGAVVLPFEFALLSTGDSGVIEATRPSVEGAGKVKEYFRIPGGKPVTRQDFDEAVLNWTFEHGSFAPYRQAQSTLVDRTGKVVFPPSPLPPELQEAFTLVRKDGDLIVCKRSVFQKGKGYQKKPTRRHLFLIWDLRSQKMVLSTDAGVEALGSFQESGLALARGLTGKYAFLKSDGTWKSAQEWAGIQSIDPIQGVYSLKTGLGKNLFDLEGNPLGDQLVNVVYPGVPGLTPVSLFHKIPDPGLARNGSWRPNLLDAKGQPVWPTGRIRLLDNQLSLLLPEDWKVFAYDLGRISLRLGQTQFNTYGASRPRYPHAVDVSALVVDRLPGEEAPQVAGRLLSQLLNNAKNLQQNALSSGPIGGRSWLQWELYQPKAVPGADGYGFGAVTLGSNQAYALILWGVHPAGKKDAPERAALRRRFDNLLTSTRFPGQADF